MPLRSFTPAELSLTERKRLEQPLLIMIWLGVVMFALAEGQLFYLLAGTLVVGVNMLAVRSGKEVSLQRLFVNLAVLGATAVLFMEIVLRDLPVLRALGHYLILIQLCKLFERKRNRDYAQMLALSLTTVVAAGLISRELWFAVMLAGYLVLAARVTMILTLKRGLDAAATARLPVEAAPLSPDRVAWNVIRNWPGSALRRRLAAVLLIMAATSILTFMLVPRLSAGPGLPPEQSSGLGGYLDQDLRLGEARSIYLSSEVVMRVRVEGMDPSPLYLRGAVFDTYAHSRWTQGPQARWAAPLSAAGPPPTDDPRGAVVQKITMHPSLLPVVYAVYPAVGIETDAGDVRHNSLLSSQIMADDRGDGPVRYTATSWVRPLNPRQKIYLENLRRAAGEQFADVSGDIRVPRRVRELAQQWYADLLEQQRQEEPSDLAVAGYLAQRMQREYDYTLDLPGAYPGRDAVEDFLLRTKRGHCEYFATALAAMCNALDVPARLAMGFLADERDSLTGQYVVRQRDAHAWVEVFTPETDWVVFDSTPGGFEEQTPSGLRERLRGFWSSLQFAWYDRVVGFDAEVQKALARRLWNLAADAGDAITAGFDRLQRSIYALLAHGYLDRVVIIFIAILAGLAAIATAAIALRAVRRHRALRRRLGDPLIRASNRLRCIPELLDELQDRGLPQRADWTLRRRAVVAAERFDLPLDTMLELARIYYCLRWGGHVPDDAEVRKAELAVGDIRGKLAA